MQCKQLIAGLLALALGACEPMNFHSSVPNAAVRIRINTSEAEFVHFVPSNVGEKIVIDHSGFHFSNGTTKPLRDRVDYCGYRGLVALVDNNGQYSAFDLCCPNCIYEPDGTVAIDGIMARCPHCGEEYDLSWGYGNPQHGISHECLRKYTCTYSGTILIIQN